MSSDPPRPTPEWWEQPQDPNRTRSDGGSQGRPAAGGDAGYQETQGFQETQGYQGTQGAGYGSPGAGYQGNQDHQETQRLPTNQGQQGFPSSQGFPGGQDYPGSQNYQGYQQNQDYPGNRGYQGGQGFPPGQGFPDARGYQAAQASQGYQGRPPRARRRHRRWPWITLIVIILVLVGADRAAAAYAEDQMASQFQSSLDLSGKPTVTIQGFPFLTQLAARDFKTVNVSASNETAGTGGLLEIASLTGVVHGMHIHGTNSATLDQFNASALVTFSALAKAGGVPQGITLSADGPNKVKANISVGPLSDTAVAQVTQTGSNQINVKIIDAGGIPTELLGNLANFNVSLPKLPAGVKIQGVSVTQQGLQVSATGQNITVSQ